MLKTTNSGIQPKDVVLPELKNVNRNEGTLMLGSIEKSTLSLVNRFVM